MKDEIAAGDLIYDIIASAYYDTSKAGASNDRRQLIATAAQLKGLRDGTMKIVAAKNLVVGRKYLRSEMPIGATDSYGVIIAKGPAGTRPDSTSEDFVCSFPWVQYLFQDGAKGWNRGDLFDTLKALPKEPKQAEFKGSICPPETDVGLTDKQREEVADMLNQDRRSASFRLDVVNHIVAALEKL